MLSFRHAMHCFLFLLILFTSAGRGFSQEIYTFESLQINNFINGQDNWVDQPGQGQATVSLNTDPENGTRVVRHFKTVAFDESAYLTRRNNGDFSFDAITDIQTGLTIQFDCAGENIAIFALGHDTNGDGMLKISEGEIGPSFGTYDRRFRVQGADLSTVYEEDFGSGNSLDDWYRIQLRIDFTGHGGSGSGSLFYKNLTDGDPAFLPLTGLQEVDLELGNMNPDAGPTAWDAMWIHVRSGGGNIPSADNLIPVQDAEFCQKDIGYGGPGSALLSLCGGDLSSGTTAELLLDKGAPNQPALLLVSDVMNPTPFYGGFLVPLPFIYQQLFAIDPQGRILVPQVAGGGGPLTLFIQFIYQDPALVSGVGLSNALEVELLP